MNRPMLRRLNAPVQVHSMAARLAEHVVAALVDEVTLAPKPGLVDVRGRGAHDDMNWALMCRSALALRPTFEAMARAGEIIAQPMQLREQIGRLGRLGETAMLNATGGINTHRGAIWALGLLVTAAAQQPRSRAPQEVAQRAAVLADIPDRFAPASTGHKGERACFAYGVGGARGQAQAGFPHVVHVALPTLWQARAAGVREDAARIDALLAIMACLDDTCVLARGGPAALTTMQTGSARVLEAGGSATSAGLRALVRLDADLLSSRVSPGGCADMLAAALFLDRLHRGDAPSDHFI